MTKLIESLEQLHAAELEALVEIDRVCKKHGIRWFLHGGTMLGAIRHGGPIPWDDDVDIAMHASDYQLFKSIAAHELNPRFKLTEPSDYEEFFDFLPRVVDTHYCMPPSREDADAFGERLEHPVADIFVFEPASVGASDARQSRQLKLNYAQALGHRPHVDHSQFKGIAKLASYVLPAVGKLKSMEQLIKERSEIGPGNTEGTGLLRIPNDLPAYWHLRFKEEWYAGERTTDFSGVELPIPLQAEQELELVYGPTWRELPPESKRHPTHAFLK